MSLREELEFVEVYLDIESARLEERLSVSWEIGPETLDAKVPHLVLQPVVEEVVRRVAADQEEEVQVTVRAHRRNGSLELLLMEQSGTRISSAGGRRIGVAEREPAFDVSWRERFPGPDHRLELGHGPEGQGMVKVILPFYTGDVEELVG